MSVIFFDIDGTIIGPDGRIPASAALAIRQLKRAGHHCVINTGRPRVSLDPELLELGFDALICACGQYVEQEGRVLRRQGFDRATSQAILEKGRACGIELYFEEEMSLWSTLRQQPDLPEFAGALENLIRRGVDIRCPDGNPDFHFDKCCLLPSSGGRVEEFLDYVRPLCQIIDRGGGMYELPMKGSSKALGCQLVAEAYGIPLADCYAIGDSSNDAEMLGCVGHPLVMGNASAEVKALAEYVTAPLEEDGLYRAMVHTGLIAPQ